MRYDMMMRKLLWLVLLLIPTWGWTATYYVDAASSGGDGTTTATSGAQAAFATITAALNAVATGNTIEVHDGTYAEMPHTKAATITIVATTGHTPHVRGIFIDHNDITLDGLYFDTVGETTSYQYRITIAENITGFLIQNVRTGIACVGGVSACQWGDLSIVGGTATGQILNNHFDHATYVSLFIRGSAHDITVKGNHWTNAHADVMYLWGANHLIQDNEVENTIGDSGLHADFVQTFGGDQSGSYGAGGASYGHIIERNYVHGSPNELQWCNLEQKGNPDTRDWTFRNNIFQDVAYAGNIYIPGVKIYNNLFLNTTGNTGHPIMTGPDVIVLGTDAKRYAPKLFTFWADINRPITGANWATYWAEDTAHPATPVTTWENGKYAYPGPSSGDGIEVKNNVFIGCGAYGGNNENLGWYGIGTGIINSAASNNYVSKRSDYTTPFGPKTGWNTNNGNVNGGNPKFVNYAADNFALLADSPLINKGATIATFTTDYLEYTRTGAWDIGPYEYGGGSADVTAPTLTGATINTSGLTIYLTFSEIVTRNAETGWTMTMSGGAATMTYLSGSASNVLVYSLSRIIRTGETGTVAWTAAVDTIEDGSGNDLETIATAAVTNTSTSDLPVVIASGAGMNIGTGAKVAIGGIPIPASACGAGTELVCESFEGSISCGNGIHTNCSVEWTMVNEASNSDFSYVTAPAPLEGSYSLRLAENVDGDTGWVKSFTASDTVHFFFMVNVSARYTQSDIVQIRDASGAPLMRILNGGYEWVITCGGSNWAYSTTMAADTTYYVWGDYTKGTGANAVCHLFHSLNTTKGSADITMTNGEGTGQAAQFFIDQDHTLQRAIYDKIRVGTSSFGDNPP
jgi:hypothetical protein